jgi:hypothetical protein
MQGITAMVTPACKRPQSVPPTLVFLARRRQDERQRERRAAIHDDEGGEELVPRGDEGEQRYR